MTSMAPLTDEQFKLILQSPEPQLLEQLGMRSTAINQDLSRSADPHLRVTASDIQAMGIKDDMKALGGRILRTWQKSAYELACGNDQDDAKTRDDLKRALGVSDAAAAGVLTAALIGVGLMAPLAPIVAAILVRKFFNPAYQDFCAFWKERLP